MPFEWVGGEEPPLEKARREHHERRIAELQFRWFNAVASGNVATAMLAALDYNEVYAEAYGQDALDDLLSDVESELAREPANDV